MVTGSQSSFANSLEELFSSCRHCQVFVQPQVGNLVKERLQLETGSKQVRLLICKFTNPVSLVSPSCLSVKFNT